MIEEIVWDNLAAVALAGLIAVPFVILIGYLTGKYALKTQQQSREKK